MKLLKHKKFIKSYLLLTSWLQEKADSAIKLFIQNPFDINLRNHALMGKMKWLRSIDVTGDIRIIFRELSEGTYEIVELVVIGTHNQIYG